jgi:predicted HAD superfamily phosphohydrolase
MATGENPTIRPWIDKIRALTQEGNLDLDLRDYYQAASLAQSVVHDTLGGNHPIMSELEGALKSADTYRAQAASRAVLNLYDHNALKNPRLAIAGEIEGDLLDIAQAQAELAEKSTDALQRQTHLGIAAFLAGASIEDALRRLCDAGGIPYDAQHTSISKLQAVLYQPAKKNEVISSSETKHITAWGDTRNKADHGKFHEITQTEVVTMIMGARSFIEKHLL